MITIISIVKICAFSIALWGLPVHLDGKPLLGWSLSILGILVFVLSGLI